jgi:hypothetical protein
MLRVLLLDWQFRIFGEVEIYSGLVNAPIETG